MKSKKVSLRKTEMVKTSARINTKPKQFSAKSPRALRIRRGKLIRGKKVQSAGCCAHTALYG